MPTSEYAGGLGALSAAHHQRERRSCVRASVLVGIGEMVVVELSLQTALLLDVSVGGLAVQAVYPPAPEATQNVAFRLPFTGDLIEAICEVGWADNASRAGLKFAHIEDAARCHLEAWLAAHTTPTEPLPYPVPEVSPEHSAGGAICGEAAQGAVLAQSDTPSPTEQHAQVRADTAVLERKIRESGVRPTPDVLARIVRLSCRLTRAGGAAIVVRDEQGVLCRASTGDAPDVGSRLKPHSGLTAECLRTGRVVLCGDANTDPRVHPPTAARLNLQSVLIVPIEEQGNVVGAVEVLSSCPFFFDATHAAKLRRITKLLAVLLSADRPTEQRQASDFGKASQQPVSTPAARVKVGPRFVQHAVAACVVLVVLGGVFILSRFSFKRNTERIGVAAQQQLIQQPTSPQENRRERRAPQTFGEQYASRRANKGEARGLAEAWQLSTAVSSNFAGNNPVGNNPGTLDQSLSVTPRPLPIGTVARVAREEVEIPPPTMDNIPEEKTAIDLVLRAPVSVPRLSAPRRPLRVSEFIQGQLVSQQLPAYPELARQLGVQGPVILRGVIGVDGNVKNLAILQGDPLLAKPAAEAINKWRYDISYLNRVPVELEMIDELEFTLDPVARVSNPLRLPHGVVVGRAVNRPLPSYPELATKLGVQGSVVMRGVIGVDGRVKHLHVVAGHPLLAQAALEAVRHWRYEVSYLDRVPIEVEKIVTVIFKTQ